MSGPAVDNTPRMKAPVFIAFYNSRSEEEMWELIDGVPIRNPAQTIIHQQLSGKLVQHLNSRLEQVRWDRQALHRIGILVPNSDSYNPEPDVTVIDTQIAPEQIYAENFYLVAEVLSESDTDDLVAAKLAFYKSHPGNKCVLLVSQDEVRIVLHERRTESCWTERSLTNPGDELVVPELGMVCTLSQIYQNTHLAP